MGNEENRAPVSLSEELIEMIIFGMENQRDSMVLDLNKRNLVPEGDCNDNCIKLPEWTPADGFCLMDGFVESLNNPLYRGRLRDVLKSGKGVFRRFKDIIKERTEIEKLWYQYKDREMKRRVKSWYEEYKDLLILESLGEEPEETESLLLSDFVVSEAELLPEGIGGWNRMAHKEAYSSLCPSLEDALFERHLLSAGNPRLDDKNTIFTAMAPDGEIVGFLWLRIYPGDEAHLYFVEQVYVKREFRGLGLAGLLIEQLKSLVEENSGGRVCVSLPSRASFLESRFKQMGFNVLSSLLIN